METKTLPTVLKAYYSVTKPGIIYGNLIAVIAGYFLAANGHIFYPLFPATLIGISFIIASGCVMNNIIDRDIDAKMDRTKSRAMVKGTIPVLHAYLFGVFLGSLGSYILGYFTNITTLIVALFGLFAYVFIYSIWSKRYTSLGTLLGSISGAVPPIVGYTAVSQHLDLAALLLFIIMVIWQMPHSYAIAIFRLAHYKNANIPVLPVRYSIRTTKLHMLFFTLLYIPAVYSMYYYGYKGTIYAVSVSILCVAWLSLALSGLSTKNDTQWAKRMFFFSLIVMVVFSIAVSLH